MNSASFAIAYCQPSRVPPVATYPVVVFRPGSLHVTLYACQPPVANVTQLRAGELRYGWVELLDGFLVLLLDSHGWIIEVGLNLLHLPAQAAQAWLREQDTELHLTLLDAATAAVLVERTVDPEPAFGRQLRARLANQWEQGNAPQVIDDVFKLLEQGNTPQELLSQATLYCATTVR